jgi:acetolactate synthase-1/2/3 large subunit
VTDASKLQDALEASFNEDGPSLIVIPIDYNENKLLTKRLGELTASFT